MASIDHGFYFDKQKEGEASDYLQPPWVWIRKDMVGWKLYS
jgi:hypothetical protein